MQTMKRMKWLAMVLAGLAVSIQLQAATTLGPWVPLFKGINHAVGTNTSSDGGFPDLQVVHILKVDLQDSDIRLFTTPRYKDYVADYTETAAMKVGYFLTNYGLQVAINANDYHVPYSSDLLNDNAANGTACGITGLLISQGLLVSSQESAHYSSSLLFTGNKTPSFVFTNYPQQSIAGISNAVTGTYAVLINGVNVGSNYYKSSDSIHHLQPRTAIGISQDNRYMYLMTIDGRQSSYSVGAYDYETAAWLKLAGAYNGINMDGGGSTTMVMANTAGKSVELNKSSLVAAYGVERTVGAHLGIYAKAVEGFVYDVTVSADDTSALISWTTLTPATGQVTYGTDTNNPNTTALISTLTTNHSLLVSNLIPGTGYYFKTVSTIPTNTYSSSDLYFVTSNYVSTNLVIDYTNNWRYTVANLDNVQWTTPAYDDSQWSGPAPGIFWVDLRGANGGIDLLSTELPSDPANGGFPCITYYFRTHFAFSNDVSGASLLINGVIDDGAVFYLNGVEIGRVRMDETATIDNATTAIAYPCEGDPTCGTDYFEVTGDALSSLVKGDNVLAVEVHNFDPASPDVVFGASVVAAAQLNEMPTMFWTYKDGVLTLNWNRSGFKLMQAPSVTGPWTATGDYTSPVSLTNSGSTVFFRLQR
jgi:hypothetical protein